MNHALYPNIREYTSADKSQCLEIFKSNCPLYFTPEEFEPFTKFLDNLGMAPIYGNSEADYFYVIEDRDRITGCGGFYKIKNENKARYAWGMIHNDCHKMKYGTILNDFRVGRIHELYPNALITLGTSQHTFGFFQKMGFKVTGITKDGYGEGMDDYEMEYAGGF